MFAAARDPTFPTEESSHATCWYELREDEQDSTG